MSLPRPTRIDIEHFERIQKLAVTIQYDVANYTLPQIDEMMDGIANYYRIVDPDITIVEDTYTEDDTRVSGGDQGDAA